MTLENEAIRLDGATRLHVIIGDPIAQVKSPTGVSLGFGARGANAVMVPVHATPEDLSTVVQGLQRMRNLDGICITMPHKFAVRAFCDRVSDRAEFLGAVNVMRRRADGGWFGDMTDGVGFVAAIRAAGGEPAGNSALLIGAGGAGSAMALALIDAGVSDLAIHDADAGRRDALIAKLGTRSRVPVSIGSADPTGFGIIANASPSGMRAGDALPVSADKLTSQMFVGCVVTTPAVPPLIERARAAGCRTSTGTDMFVAQQYLLVDFLLGRDTPALASA